MQTGSISNTTGLVLGRHSYWAHGAYDSGLQWLPLAENLADEWELVTYDARGHGHSDAPSGGYTINDRIKDFRGLIEALELKRDEAVLMGHSMGASTVRGLPHVIPRVPGQWCSLIHYDYMTGQTLALLNGLQTHVNTPNSS